MKAALWLCSLIALYLIAALIGAVFPGLRADVGPTIPEREIILAVGPIHYDILLPLDEDTRATFAPLTTAVVPVDAAGMRWLSLGWGSDAFYTTAGQYSDVTFRAMVTAATGDSAVLRVEVYGPLPDHPKLRRIALSQAQLDVLRASIADTFVATTPLPIDGFSETDAFYPALGNFNIIKTCNDWVRGQLAAAGLNVGAWTPTPYALTLSLWWNGHLD